MQAGNVVVLDEKNPHIRNTRDGTVIELDVNSGVCTMDMWVCLEETGPVLQLSRTVSGSGTKCSSGGEECYAQKELNGLEEGEDAMTDEEGEGVGGEGEAGTADRRVRAGPRNTSTAREREELEASHMLGAHTARWAEVALITTCQRKEVRTCRGDQ